MRYRFIEDHRGQWPVQALCDALQVGTAGYYAWRVRPTSARAQRQATLSREIGAIHARVKARYGSPRMHAELVSCGHRCCVNTVAKVMREAGIAAKTKQKFRHMIDDSLTYHLATVTLPSSIVRRALSRRRFGGGFRSPVLRLLGPIAWYVQLHDHAVVYQSVDRRRRRHWILENRFPARERQVARQ